VNLAARLCAHVGRGQTLISQSTCAALADLSELVVEAVEPIQVKGTKDPVVVHRLRAAHDAHGHLAGIIVLVPPTCAKLRIFG
jgi:class 3 adenylate cyclase